MQHTWNLRFDEEAKVLEDGKLIRHVFQKNQKDIGIFLSYYFRKQGAVAEEPEILNEIQIASEGLGRVDIGFRLVYFNACLNIHELEKDKMQISFNVDRQSGTLELIGPDWPERGMDEI